MGMVGVAALAPERAAGLALGEVGTRAVETETKAAGALAVVVAERTTTRRLRRRT